MSHGVAFVALVRRIAAGDREAFAELYDGIGPTLYAGLRRRCPAHVAEALVEAAFLQIWTCAPRCPAERDGQVVAWIAAAVADALEPRGDASARVPLRADPPATGGGPEHPSLRAAPPDSRRTEDRSPAAALPSSTSTPDPGRSSRTTKGRVP